MSIPGLTAQEGDANAYVKDCCSHNYPQSASTADLATLMSHSDIASQIEPFASQYAASVAKGKSYIFGETNSGLFLFPFQWFVIDYYSSNRRRRWNQPYLWGWALDCGLCDANRDYGGQGRNAEGSSRDHLLILSMRRRYIFTSEPSETVSNPAIPQPIVPNSLNRSILLVAAI